MKAKLGPQAATIATAHKIAVIFYTMIKEMIGGKAIHSHTLSVHLANTTKVVRVVPCSRCAADVTVSSDTPGFVFLQMQS